MNRRTTAVGAAIAAVLATTLSATALATADAAPSHARTSAKAGAFTVTASVNNDEPLEGSKIKIKGSVKPAAPGAKVTLQLRYSNQKKWKNVGKATLSAASKFKFKDKVTSVRERKYRVLKQAGPNRAAGHSKALKVTVFGWRTLDSLSPVLENGIYEAGTVKINAVAYPYSLEAYNFGTQPYHIDYNLNRDCKTFEGRFGVSDRSTALGTVNMSLVADTTTKFTGSFGLTLSQAVTTDVTGVFRITINATTANDGVAAVASPQVLCSF